MSKAATLPSPVEELEAQTKADEAELIKLREDALNAPDEPEELEEDSLPSDDTEESEPEEEPVQPSEEEETEVVEEQEPELSKRGQDRFRKLSEERRAAIEENAKLKKDNENLLSIVQALQDQGYTQKQAQEIAPQIEEGYINPQQSPQDIARQTEAIINKKLAEREYQNQVARSAEMFNEDLKKIEQEHPELNEDAPEYDDDLSNFVAELYQSRSAKNPNVRLTEVVEQVMKVRGKAAEEAQKKQADKVAKQASKQAMTSTGGKTETTNLATKLAEVDSEAELAELRKLLPQT